VNQWRIEVSSRRGFADPRGQAVRDEIRELGIETVEAVVSARVYLIEAEMDAAMAKRAAEELLTDTVCQECYIGRSTIPSGPVAASIIEVHLKSGVTDPVAESVVTALKDMGVPNAFVRTARKYVVLGSITDAQRDLIARNLANDCIEEVVFGADAEPPSAHTRAYELQVRDIPIRDLDDEGLMRVSKQMDLFLNAGEMQTIQSYFRQLGREPRDIELESLAQTWSEHCVHKTLKSRVEMDFDGQTIHFENLLKETVFRGTQELAKPWCISVFSDNAGVVEFDDQDAVCFKVETHNHPSALDPYGGAATGIGGVIRDPMGTGMGAKPIANTDIFCFAPPDTPMSEVPRGVLHPKRIMRGVVSGVRDYGNRMGIPTVNGALYFDRRYMANPLVFCGNLGLIPRDMAFKHVQAGDLAVVVGGRTGRDGIHGATFSSGEMTHEHDQIFSHAVQIGNAITEKKMLDVLLQARDLGLYTAITDCGAGGLSSAVGEMGAELGAEVDLEKVPLKYAGLNYTEIWISEAQERMVIAVRPENAERILALFASEDVEATIIGRFTGDKQLVLRYQGTEVGRIEMEFLHEGIGKQTRKAVWKTRKLAEPNLPPKDDYTADLLGILGSYNVASKEWVIRQYDHEVLGGSVVKPLVGARHDGPSDAAVIRPKLTSARGVALACGMNPMYGDIDPYWMALSGIDEAIRNLICVGTRPDRIAILDNFCWGDCNRPETMGTLVRAAQACYDAAIGYSTPFISGKDSLNNEFRCEDGSRIAIPATLLISGLGIVDDVHQCVTMDAKRAGNWLFVVGLTRNELGGSHYYKLHNELGANVPRVEIARSAEAARRIHQTIVRGLIVSCHDCSEGGLAVALAEMAMAGDLGIDADLRGQPCSEDCIRADARLFSESNGRYVVEVPADRFDAFAKLMLNVPFGQVGRVVEGGRVTMRQGGKVVIDTDIAAIRNAWQNKIG
jgi:phosphoribosylformylglycinamidine synthase II